MAKSLKRRIFEGVNKALYRADLELVKKEGAFQDYIPFRQTIADVEKSGLSMADYIDNNFNVPGTTQLTIDKMRELGAFDGKVSRVCEIGPGSGRYLEKVKAACTPDHYEIYETARPWREYLVEKYNVVAQPTDGASLKSTPSKSIDLIHTHKVLYGNDILTIFRYMMEMARVVRDGGVVVFDLVTAECINNEIMAEWVKSGVDHAHSMTPRSVALDYFSAQGFCHCGNFIVPMAPGVTEYFIFRKEK